MTVKRALISVSDKTGLLELAHGLVELGVELIATSGTAAYLAEHNLQSTKVEDLTGDGPQDVKKPRDSRGESQVDHVRLGRERVSGIHDQQLVHVSEFGQK